MTKNDIVLRIASDMNMRQTDVKKVVQMLLDGIIDILEEEGRLELRNFGVFEVKERKARKARNPRTGEEVMVPACKVVTFKAGKRMEEIISELKSPEDTNTDTPPAQNNKPADDVKENLVTTSN